MAYEKTHANLINCCINEAICNLIQSLWAVIDILTNVERSNYTFSIIDSHIYLGPHGVFSKNIYSYIRMEINATSHYIQLHEVKDYILPFSQGNYLIVSMP